MVSHDFTRQITDNYRLTTAEILYHMPDHPSMLQTYIWQDYDVAPIFPELRGFLEFWTKEIDGKLHSVYMAHKKIIEASQFKPITAEFTLQ